MVCPFRIQESTEIFKDDMLTRVSKQQKYMKCDEKCPFYEYRSNDIGVVTYENCKRCICK
jgi:hypothetical protein